MFDKRDKKAVAVPTDGGLAPGKPASPRPTETLTG